MINTALTSLASSGATEGRKPAPAMHLHQIHVMDADIPIQSSQINKKSASCQPVHSSWIHSNSIYSPHTDSYIDYNYKKCAARCKPMYKRKSFTLSLLPSLSISTPIPCLWLCLHPHSCRLHHTLSAQKKKFSLYFLTSETS